VAGRLLDDAGARHTHDGDEIMAATMADKRRFLAELAEGDGHGRVAVRARQAAIAVVVAGLLAAGLLWLSGWFSAPAPVRELRSLIDQQIAVLDRVARNEVPLSEVSFAPIYERSRDLPREYRDQFRGQFERLFVARESAEVASFFRLPAAQRQAELDRRIKAEEQRRQQWMAARASRQRSEADRGGRPAGGAGGTRPAPGGGAAAGAASGRGQPAGGTRGGTAATGPTARRGTSQDAWNQRSKAAIDRSTPEQRAQRTEYRRVMAERREQLGVASRR
jgi:hypothetical protein